MIPPPILKMGFALPPRPPQAFTGIPEPDSALSSRRSSSVLLSQYDDVISSHHGGSSLSSTSSPRHSVTVIQGAGNSLDRVFNLSECRLQRLARNFLYPEDDLKQTLKRIPPATYALCNKYTEPVPRPSSSLAVALPTRPSYLNSSMDRRTQTPRCLSRRRSSNWTNNTPSDGHSRPSSRRPVSSDLHVPCLEEDEPLDNYYPDVTLRAEGACSSTDFLPHHDVITLPRVTMEEDEEAEVSTTFMDLVKGLAIPYITVSRSSTPSVLDVRTMSEVVGRVRSAKKHLPPTGGSSALGSRTKTKVNQPYLTPGGGARLASNIQGGSK